IKDGNISGITVVGDKLELTFADETKKLSKKEANTALTTTLKNYEVSEEELAKINIEVRSDRGFLYWFASLAPIILPIVFIVFFIWFLTRQVKGAGMQAFTFGQSKARMTHPDDKSQKVTFKDVAGCKEAKEELKEIVDFLKNPKKFLDIGARIPKGILLMGAPGTGKTLLARAVAGEAGVSFFSISGSEFVEMFVGVGASRVRDLFDLAKKAAPAIIFVDEIDAVGRVRGTGVGGGNDEREQTLNQILVELDGFEPNEKVIVMAATNRPDVLDPALLRPGRFDRRVTLDLPDRKDREEILLIHARKKPFAEDVNLPLIAERTPGFSGADLYSLMNEAAILAARENRTKVSQFDLIRSIEKVMLGPERRSHILSKKEKELTAYHEAGHALVASILPYADPVHKISIISRGRVAGYVLKLPLEDRKMQSKKEFLDDIATALGGYVVEKNIFHDITTGPSNDLQVATARARDMVTKFGMSEKMGPVALEGPGGKPLFGMGVGDKDYSEKVGAMIDAEVSEIMNEAMKKVEKIVKENRKALDAIAKRLIEVETIEQKEFEELLVANGITPKKKKDIEHQA
ncbi:MAG: ATP-dependent zinc metalloprotease FtsH, partial [Minisyncoccia bacterium]